MGIERLKGSLLSEATEDARKIVESAETHVQRMIEEERSKTSAVRKDAEEQVERLLQEQRNERLAWARLESKRIIAEAREDAIKSVLEDFFELLQKARKDKEYKRFMSTAIAQAATELGQTVTIHVLEGEKSLVPSVKGAKVVDDLEALGGAIVESSDGKVMIDLTLETLFETRRDEIRKQVYEKLFGDK